MKYIIRRKVFSHVTILYMVICALLLILFLERCSTHNNVFQTIPKIEGTLTDVKPLERDSLIITDKKLKEEIKNIVISKELDSLEKVVEFETKPEPVKKEMYKKSLDVKTYQNKVEDDDVKIEYTAVTTGTLDYINFDYTVKERVVEKPKNKNHFYLGGSISNNLELNRPSVNALIGVQNKKGDILQVSYGTDKTISVGYMFRLF